MKQLTHGGDWAGYRAEFGRDPASVEVTFSGSLARKVLLKSKKPKANKQVNFLIFYLKFYWRKGRGS